MCQPRPKTSLVMSHPKPRHLCQQGMIRQDYRHQCAPSSARLIKYQRRTPYLLLQSHPLCMAQTQRLEMPSVWSSISDYLNRLWTHQWCKLPQKQYHRTTKHHNCRAQSCYCKGPNHVHLIYIIYFTCMVDVALFQLALYSYSLVLKFHCDLISLELISEAMENTKFCQYRITPFR